jgi:hypothetical protein
MFMYCESVFPPEYVPVLNRNQYESDWWKSTIGRFYSILMCILSRLVSVQGRSCRVLICQCLIALPCPCA